jgi:Pyruvate phosphate dikinase, AMP/ATP-binding domain/Cyclic nucleotide-binding domain
MKAVVGLEEAHDTGQYGSKAVGLGDAARGGLPIPPGFALSGDIVDAVAADDDASIAVVLRTVAPLSGPFAVRSSAVDEDGADASFAGQHMTLLNVPSTRELTAALKEIWWSANSDSAITYRQRVGLFTRPSIAVVVQSLLDPESAGVMFTRNPINGADERLIEASWGLGETVVAGRVIPDTYRVARSGEVLERAAGYKKILVRSLPDGGTVEEAVAPELVESLCLDDEQLGELGRLAARCEEVYGPGRDIEWAIAGGQLYLLQCRAVTRVGGDSAPSSGPSPAPSLPLEELKQIPLFAGLRTEDLAKVHSLFKERRFAPGETVTKEGSGGAAFFLIESGEAAVTVRGQPRPGMKAGDFFGEIALIDGGERAATVTAVGELVCHGLTYWDFQPLVKENAAIAWALLQVLAKRVRADQER